VILSIRSSFKKLLVLQRDYLMVLGEKHGTNYLPYTKYMDWIQQWQSNLINKMGWFR